MLPDEQRTFIEKLREVSSSPQTLKKMIGDKPKAAKKPTSAPKGTTVASLLANLNYKKQ